MMDWLRFLLTRWRLVLAERIHPDDLCDGRLVLTFGDQELLDARTDWLRRKAEQAGGELHLTGWRDDGGQRHRLRIKANGKPATLEFHRPQQEDDDGD